jgi:haloalkane dehalogenase
MVAWARESDVVAAAAGVPERSPPWDLDAICRETLTAAGHVVDLGPGGGEQLLGFAGVLPADTVATERWPPHVPVLEQHTPVASRPGEPQGGRVDALSTPAERFEGITGYDYRPAWVGVTDGLRLAYVDEGPRDGPPVVLLHGEPTWGYLYRNLVPPLVDAGLRVVVPDLIGFGRSDKPVRREDYSYARHVEWLRAALFDALRLDGVHVVGQDWGGLIGMRLLAEHPDRFAGVVMANTGLPTGDVPMPDEWQRFRAMVDRADTLDVARMVDSGCLRSLTPEERRAYEAPFPDEAHSAGARAFPGLVPNTPDDPAAPANRAAWQRLSTLQTPFLCAFSDGDPITRGGDRWMRSRIPGAAGRAHTTITGAGHFLQEDRPEQLADVVVRFVASVEGRD